MGGKFKAATATIDCGLYPMSKDTEQSSNHLVPVSGTGRCVMADEP